MFGKSKEEKVDKPAPTGFTREQKSKQQGMSDLFKLNKHLNKDGEIK
jgi:hypothetical protein